MVHARPLALFGAGLLLGSTVGLVSAAIPSGSGVYSACYETRTGTLHLIDSSISSCPKGEQGPVTWNQAGPQGPAGPQGSPGPAGPSGAPGLLSSTYMRSAAQATDGGDSVIAFCDTGDMVLGGGGAASLGGTLRIVRPYVPPGAQAPVGYAATVSTGDTVFAYVICGDVAP